MQADLLRKAASIGSNNARASTQDKDSRDGFLQDELMQELVQRKTYLESFVESPAAAVSSNTLRHCVEQTLHNYFTHLDGQPVTHIYEMVLSEVEAPLL